MAGALVRIQKVRLKLHHLLQREGADIQNGLDRHVCVLAVHDGNGLVETVDALLNLCQVCFLHQIGFVEQDLVCEDKLLHCLVLGTLWLLLIQMLNDVLRVHYGDDSVELTVLLDTWASSVHRAQDQAGNEVLSRSK